MLSTGFQENIAKLEIGKKQIQNIEVKKKRFKEIKADLENANRVSFDVYDYQNKLLVIHDFKSKEKAENTALRIAKEIPELRLKNNFVALSSQYKNILIYKTLDLN